MNIFNNPAWIREFQFPYKKVDEVPQHIYDEINAGLDRLSSDTPDVTILIPAWNEEVNILPTMASLAKSSTQRKLEFVVVNNNSSDRTQEVLDKLHVRSFFQPIQGVGAARQMGMENAKGKEIIMTDADTLIPPNWIDGMADVLQKPGVAVVVGRYSFIAEGKTSRWQLFVYEKLKNVMVRLRQAKRPHLNALGFNMGFHRADGMKVGFDMRNVRGEDGRMAFDLLQHGFGRMEIMKRSDAVVWTSMRNLERDGSFAKALWNRIKLELGRLGMYFVPQAPHDTKTSEN